METNEVSKDAKGGTELMLGRIHSSLPADLLSNFQIIPSRVRSLDEGKIRILYLHDLPGDPESDAALGNMGWKKFHALVFVSNWQMQAYISRYNIPWSKCRVIQNSIEPIERQLPQVTDDKIRFIYHTTPHRGLNILAAVFEKLAEKHKNIHLEVFSSFKLYGENWAPRDADFGELFDRIKAHPQMTYYGAQPNEDIRFALQAAHVYAYPCTWLETSCLSLIEAMSAGVICVHPNYGALSETAANWTHMYQWQEDPNQHAAALYNILSNLLDSNIFNESVQSQLANQQAYANLFYNWNSRKHQWEAFLRSLLNEPRNFPKEEYVYRG